MDKYQQTILKYLRFTIVEQQYSVSQATRKQLNAVHITEEDGEYYLNIVRGGGLQTLYNLCVSDRFALSSTDVVPLCSNVKILDTSSKESSTLRKKFDKVTLLQGTAIIVPIDFDNQIEALCISINDSLVEPIELRLKYIK